MTLGSGSGSGSNTGRGGGGRIVFTLGLGGFFILWS